MGLNRFTPKHKTQEILLLILKNTVVPNKQTKRKPQETLETKTQKSLETFSNDIPVELKGEWMLRLTTLEI